MRQMTLASSLLIIDGLIINMGSPFGADADTLAQVLGLDLRMYSQTWAHGRFAATCIQHAAMAVASGMADVVACMASLSATGVRPGLTKGRRRSGGSGAAIYAENAREGGGGHGQDPVFGINSPDGGAAMAAQLYFDRYGVTSNDLAEVAVSMRRHGSLNPGATQREPITVEDHQASPLMAAPLRLLDYPQLVDGAGCVLVTRADKAHDMRKTRC